MTAPNLTPAEALECLRDWFGTMSVTMFMAKHNAEGGGYCIRLCQGAVAALETLLSEHEATKAKLAAYEAKGSFPDMMLGHYVKRGQALQEELDAIQEPAAAVPNDRSIAQAIEEKIHGPDLRFVLRLLAQRIGVKL